MAACGQEEAANRLLFQEREPSWLYEIGKGATTLWESWDAVDEAGNPKPYSFNHFAFGCVGEYLFRHIAGIRSAAPGFAEVRIEPDYDCGLTSVQASYDSAQGRISVSWEKEGKQLHITLPPDMKGTAVLEGKEYPIRCGSWDFYGNSR